MSFDYNRIRRGEMISAISAVVLIIVMFLPWYDFTGSQRIKYLILVGGHSLPLTGSAWKAYSNTSLLLVVLVLVALAPAVVSATQQRVNFPLSAAAAALGALVGLFIIYKLFIHRPGGNTYTDVAVGGYLGLLAIIGITVGAFLTAQEDGWSWGDADGRASEVQTAAGAGAPTARGSEPGARTPGASAVEPGAGTPGAPGVEPSREQQTPPRRET
jgi:hypothetical protein